MELPKEVIAAIIALTGVVLSIVISFVTSRRAIQLELRKLRLQAQQTYESKLLEIRLAVYPEVYSYLSSFIKEAQRNLLSKTAVETLLSKLDEWDSKNSIYLSGDASNTLYDFRAELFGLLKESDEELTRKFRSIDFLCKLRDQIVECELALRCDLGIYGLDFSEARDEMKTRKVSQY